MDAIDIIAICMISIVSIFTTVNNYKSKKKLYKTKDRTKILVEQSN